MKVLIAEDSDSDRLILGALLRKLDHEVLEAKDGTEAVALFTNTEPDIVLLDALMPRMDGMEAARQIKALAGERLVPVMRNLSVDCRFVKGGGGGDHSSDGVCRVLDDGESVFSEFHE